VRSIAARTARVVRSLAGRVPLMTCETVVIETPARRATSDMVATLSKIKGCELDTQALARKRLRP
jgi:hypothetical protein